MLQGAEAGAPELWADFMDLVLSLLPTPSGSLLKSIQKVMDAALSMAPRSAKVLCTAGRVHSLAGAYREAMNAFEMALRSDPSNVHALLGQP